MTMRCNMMLSRLWRNSLIKHGNVTSNTPNSFMINRASLGRQSNGSGIKAWMVIRSFSLSFFLLFSIYDLPGAESQLPLLKPTCDHLDTTPCTKVFSKDAYGKDDFKYYYERCSSHACVHISPKKPPPPPPGHNLYWLPPAPDRHSSDEVDEETEEGKQKAAGYFSKVSSKGFSSDSKYGNESSGPQQKSSPKASRGNSTAPDEQTRRKLIYDRMSKYWDPKLVGVDSEGRFVRAEITEEFWFCSGGGAEDNPWISTIIEGVEYDARVTTNTQRSLGLTEDLKAHCEFLRFMDLLFRSSCDYTKQFCESDCLPAARIFYCAMSFPMCKPTPQNIYGTGINLANNQSKDVIYVPNNLPAHAKINASYVIVKPCRGVCWSVVRGCAKGFDFTCHLREARDYVDSPHCNWLESENAFHLYL